MIAYDQRWCPAAIGEDVSIGQSSGGLTQSVARMQRARGVSELAEVTFVLAIIQVIAEVGFSRSRLIQLVCVCRKYFLGMRFTNRCFPQTLVIIYYIFQLINLARSTGSISWIPIFSVLFSNRSPSVLVSLCFCLW